MNASEYLDPGKFPKTTQPGLDLRQQMRIDAHNLDELLEHQQGGQGLSPDQQARLRELQQKRQAWPGLKQELRQVPRTTT